LGALLLPGIGERLGRRATHALCLVFGAVGLVGFLLVEDPLALWLPTVGVGLAWAAILSMPYAMLAGSVPPGKAGVYMGIHNMFLVIPQLVASTMLAPGRPYLPWPGRICAGPCRRRAADRGRLRAHAPARRRYRLPPIAPTGPARLHCVALRASVCAKLALIARQNCTLRLAVAALLKAGIAR